MIDTFIDYTICIDTTQATCMWEDIYAYYNVTNQTGYEQATAGMNETDVL